MHRPVKASLMAAPNTPVAICLSAGSLILLKAPCIDSTNAVPLAPARKSPLDKTILNIVDFCFIDDVDA